MYLRRDELKGIIVSKGKTQKDVADYLDMSEKTFNTKLKNGIFGSDDIDKMIDFLEIEDPMWIFFDRKVTLKDTKQISFVKLQ
ncbi:DUF739 domain-containing protein [Anaerococcus hydrogenalis]|uniref:DUF739 domain-containing protein n=1 Tax=Anaerococcus hydrogenalis TaxID=33029 RepID=A0A2N6UIC0_9FIRM|nr:DUF739 domain-containing protein [Anaerococcus hydrogenalis]MDK7694753.1 hypothetical protein [Anaerococcus hydrogenalis]MDK7696693.1 hypothetical protein [Anaerococcus hydrogenalis]MDK7707780.1 hypothetical protein [Anaerococcus hydrogenalis]PMC81390.1 DUF739 domain-containing protein [Anaerococcus hydrogenalis]